METLSSPTASSETDNDLLKEATSGLLTTAEVKSLTVVGPCSLPVSG